MEVLNAIHVLCTIFCYTYSIQNSKRSMFPGLLGWEGLYTHYHTTMSAPPPDSKYLVTDYTQSCKIILVNSHCRNGNGLAITNTGNGLKPELVTLQSASMTQTVAQRSQNYLFSGDKMTRLQCQHSKMDGCSRSARMEV